MRFSYDHIADVRRVRMRPHGHGHLTRPRITPIHTLVRTHRRAASVRNPHAPAHMRTMRVRDAHGGIAVRDEQHRAPLAAPTRQSIAESRIRCRRRGDSVGSSNNTSDALRRKTRARPMRCRSPSESRPPNSPTGVSRPCGSESTSSSAEALASAARSTSSPTEGVDRVESAESAAFHETGGAGGVRSALPEVAESSGSPALPALSASPLSQAISRFSRIVPSNR